MLVKAAKYAGYQDLKDQILESAEAMYKNYVFDALKVDHDSNATKGFYQWSSMAFYEIYTSGWEGVEKYAEYAIDLAYWMIDVHDTLRRRRNTGYAYEGLASAWELARLTHNRAAMKKIGAVIDMALIKLISWQVEGPIPNDYLRANRTRDAKAIGGVLNSRQRPFLRIDVTQHQSHAIILARRYIYSKRKFQFANNLIDQVRYTGESLFKAWQWLFPNFGDFSILFLGDTSFGENYQKREEERGSENILKTKGYDYPLKKFRRVLLNSDLVISNLESPITDMEVSPFEGQKRYIHKMASTIAPKYFNKYNMGISFLYDLCLQN